MSVPDMCLPDMQFTCDAALLLRLGLPRRQRPLRQAHTPHGKCAPVSPSGEYSETRGTNLGTLDILFWVDDPKLGVLQQSRVWSCMECVYIHRGSDPCLKTCEDVCEDMCENMCEDMCVDMRRHV